MRIVCKIYSVTVIIMCATIAQECRCTYNICSDYQYTNYFSQCTFK